ncbi:MAG: bifunctional molybdopterin-guanine dinucleotide biosynthesis adaptor protein MobB/molybdopterin molybdotransferase MoeA [Paracoccaceae bacterium]
MRVFGIVGWKNAGKTGLMERLVAEISSRGFSVSTVKHAHHSFDVDHPGKDSYRHRNAGAQEVLLSSRKRWALMHEHVEQQESVLSSLLARLSDVDLVLVEGYKRDDHPKIEAHRAVTGNPLIATEDPTVLAVASDTDLGEMTIPVFDLDNTTAVADFVLRQVGLMPDTAAATKPDLAPPRLKDDCFALPAGVAWVPVDQALDSLKSGLNTVVGQEVLPVSGTLNRVLSTGVIAPRSNPPGANSAVDGYGFAQTVTITGTNILKLVEGRSAAGSPLPEAVPLGKAVRILTGALLPPGVDTVVLQEDVTLGDGHVAFEGPVKPGANARRAGEDVEAGSCVLAAQCRIAPQDQALLSAVGCASVSVFKKLRVGVLSTGDEIVAAGSDMTTSKTFDANRPMLLGLADKWGYEAIDLGHIGDDRDALRACLDRAAQEVDAIFTSGGASAGDEDHVSALLSDAGALTNWRIAMKPGRPLVLGVWEGVPVFGLPGNPVAALICALIFGRPAMSVLAGGAWREPQAFLVPAAFEKRKKPGRREYLRARMNSDGAVEVFASEGSGRISGLSWADGLVELEDGELHVRKGDPVRYIPFASFGI